MLGATRSVCPVCLQTIPAQRVAQRDAVYLTKSCPEHGPFETVVWRGLSSYRAWGATGKAPSQPPLCATTRQRGCPADCGLCPEHRQHTCCVVLEVTRRCNLTCPFCFAASSDGHRDPTPETIESWCRMLLDSGGPFNIQLSGGEPTVRPDLPEIVARIRSLGFTFVQLNTNGLRLAEDVQYLSDLRRAGLGCVFLQFDGLTEDVYRRLRGRTLLQAKLQAIRNCAEQQLGVVLVPTLVPGVNSDQIGDIIRFAVERMPAVRAVHFQPVSYFGRYPRQPRDDDRMTLPEVIRQIEQQTGEMVHASDFHPGSGENAYCSFSGKFTVDSGGELRPSAREQPAACCGSASTPQLVQMGAAGTGAGEEARRVRRFVARHWSHPQAGDPGATSPGAGINLDSLDAFLAEEKRSFCISGMVFQDAWNLDLDRLQECYVHAIAPDSRLIPLCAYNLTDREGRALHRSQRGGGQAPALPHNG